MSRVRDTPVLGATRVRDVRVAAEAACAGAGRAPERTADAALVATEPATDPLRHTGGGRTVIDLVHRADTGSGLPGGCLRGASPDHGPGIADVPAALRHGCSTGSLGAGPGTRRRTADDFDLHGTPGRGTVAVARSGREAPTARRAGGVTVPLARAEESGDAWSLVRAGARPTLMLADGLGHGSRAARASTAAEREPRHAARMPPAGLLRHLDTAPRPTRGAAVAVAQLGLDTGRLAFAGVGTVGARLRTDGARRPLESRPGLVGGHRPAAVPVQQCPWGRNSVPVRHGDGLPGRWTPPGDAGLLARDPAVVAVALLRDAGSAARPARDDTSVAVLAPRAADRRP
ncbi:SpoIIE family protein phosphatase [Streptomyces fumanus]|uniref:PPM-type phosphatase domain-containing protein n=1 Tax=Streptomyces fumanus TaxID=67302 RepID=A0A919A9M2_9ACTN|nr:SpoIIE family protein phosphatase [Streptomyces fumanus]GHE93391.1 hypothetical protein GCM10018772_16460 [Streptomyces fumanus]